ncbi:MAG: dihydroorotase [Cyanobacteria bacterium P01_E01_bin.45]
MFEADRSYVFQNIRIINPSLDVTQTTELSGGRDLTGGDSTGDVWIDKGVLKAIAARIEGIPDGSEVVDASGWVIGPGLVDLYAQSGEPGYEQRETLQSLGQAALAGGFTQVGLLPTTHPVVDTPDRLQAILNQASTFAPQWLPYAAITQNAAGESLTELAELNDSGAIAFCDNHPIASLPLLRRFLEYVHPLQMPILLWPQEPALAGGAMLEGEWSIRLGVKGICAAAEPLAIAQILELVALTNTPVHLMRLSQARSVELVRQARSSGLPISASTTWMHLLLCDRDIEPFHYHPALHLAAPLGTERDRQALIEAVKDGAIAAIATDHTPYTFEEKTVSFAEAPAGAIGLELALPLLWQELVKSGTMSAEELWAALSTHSASVLGIAAPQLTVGEPANCTIFDPDLTWNVDEQSLSSLSAATPYWHKTVKGKPLACWHHGNCWSHKSL